MAGELKWSDIVFDLIYAPSLINIPFHISYINILYHILGPFWEMYINMLDVEKDISGAWCKLNSSYKLPLLSLDKLHNSFPKFQKKAAICICQ